MRILSVLVAFALLTPNYAAAREPLAVAWVEDSNELLEEFDEDEFFFRPLIGSVVVLGVADANWPLGIRRDEISADQRLYLMKLHGAAADIRNIDGITLIERRGDFVLVALRSDALTRLPIEFQGEELRLRPTLRSRTSMLLHGKIAVDPAIKTAIVDAVDASALEQNVRDLSGAQSFELDGQTRTIPERHACRPGIDLSADYMQDRLETLGYPVFRQSFSIPSQTRCPGGATGENVIAVKTGSSLPDEIVVVGAHYDSISFDNNANGPAPGAEDNGSGTAAVLHLASIFANYSTERTIHFVLFSGEETTALR